MRTRRWLGASWLLWVALLAAAGFAIGPRFLHDERADVLRRFHELQAEYLRFKAGETRVSQYGHLPFDRVAFEATIRELGRLRVDSAVPQLAVLMSNAPAPYADVTDECADALAEIGSVPALFAVASELGGAGAEPRAQGKVVRRLLAVGEPIVPILLQGLASREDVIKRRALRALAAIHHSDLHRRFGANSDVFELPFGTAQAILHLLKDPSPAVRLDAFSAYQALGGEEDIIRRWASRETSLSVRNRLLLPWHLSRTTVPLSRALFYRSTPPQAEDFSIGSSWVPYDDGHLEYRLAVTTTTLHLPEPLAGLNAPVWIRAELRNPHDDPKEFHLWEWGWPRSLVFWLHDDFGRQAAVHPGHPGTVSEGRAPTIRSRVLAPGDSACWQFDLLREVAPNFNGEYHLRVEHRRDSPALLNFQVADRPEAIWARNDAHELGFDPSRLYYEDLRLPGGNRVLARMSATASDVPDPVVEGLVSRFLGGEQSALIELTRRLSLHEISKRIRSRQLSLSAPEGLEGVGSGSPSALGLERADLEMVLDEYLEAARDAEDRGDVVGAFRYHAFLLENSRSFGSIRAHARLRHSSRWLEEGWERGNPIIRRLLLERLEEKGPVGLLSERMRYRLGEELAPRVIPCEQSG